MCEINGRYVHIDGQKAYYETFGSGPPMLLIHTAGRDNRQWHGVMERLGERFTLFAPDLPGHGKSWPTEKGYCLDHAGTIAIWLNQFMAAVNAGRYVVMGCSLGGNLTLLMAAMFDTVSAVIGLQAAAQTPTFSEASLRMMTHPQVSLMHANMDFSMSLVGSAASVEARAFSEWGVLSIIPLAQQASLTAYNRCDFADRLGDISVPVLLAHGTEDWLVTDDMVKAALGGLKQAPVARFVALHGLGHFPHLEDPGRVAAMTLGFLDEVGL